MGLYVEWRDFREGESEYEKVGNKILVPESCVVSAPGISVPS